MWNKRYIILYIFIEKEIYQNELIIRSNEINKETIKDIKYIFIEKKNILEWINIKKKLTKR